MLLYNPKGMASMPSFERRLRQALEEHLTNPSRRYLDNSLDYYIASSAEKRKQAMDADKLWFRQHQPLPDIQKFLQENEVFFRLEVATKTQLYNLLGNAQSKRLLVLVALYWLLGHRFVKFPYYKPDSIALRDALARQYAVPEPDDTMRHKIAQDAFGVGFILGRYRVPIAGTDITLYSSSEFVYDVFHFPLYRYEAAGVCIDVEEGDIVLDCGACYGDTALQFAAKAGSEGRVLSFEPHPLLSQLYEYNRNCNPELSKRMELIRRPVGEDSQTLVNMVLCGPGTYQGKSVEGLHSIEACTTRIDDEVAQRGLTRVDFLKMDIEGAELSALRGAEQTIRRYQPKLAICLYHQPQDFLLIPEWLAELGLGYRFYLQHHYMNNWETVLYAKVE